MFNVVVCKFYVLVYLVCSLVWYWLNDNDLIMLFCSIIVILKMLVSEGLIFWMMFLILVKIFIFFL